MVFRCLSRPALVGIVLISCAGCAVDGRGLTLVDLYDADDATVVRLRTLGLAVRSQPDDAGFTLGLSDRLYVVAPPLSAAPGRYWFAPPAWDPGRSIAMASFSVGLEFLAARPEPGLSLGLSQRVVLAQLPAGASVLRSIRMSLANPERTVVSVGEVCSPC